MRSVPLDPDADPLVGRSPYKPFAPAPSQQSPFTTTRLVIGALIVLTTIYLFRPSTFSLSSCPTRPPPTPTPSMESAPSSTNVLITGGAGYIGSHMAVLLSEQSETYNVIAIDDLSRGDMRNVHNVENVFAKANKKFSFVEGDCGNIALVAPLLKEHKIDVVIHFAGFAYASESVQYPLRYFDNIVTKTQNLLAAINDSDVRRLVYSSSSATYGQPLNEACDVPISEQSPQIPVSPYGRSKLMAEQVIQAYHHAKNVVEKQPFSYAALRYFNVVGADKLHRVGPLPHKELKQWSRIVDACFDAATEDKPMTVYGSDYPTADGTAIRDYIHVSDLVRAHLAVMKAVHDQVAIAYNVGIGHGFSNKELVAACSAATKKDIPIVYGPRRAGDPSLVLGDASKIRSDLHWKPEYTDLTEIVRTAWEWRVQTDEQTAKDAAANTPAQVGEHEHGL